MAIEYLSDGDREPAVGNPDLGTDGVILHGRLNQRLCRGRTIYVDRACALVVPCDRHQRAKSCGVIVMVMSNEDGSDVADINASLGDPSCNAVACIDDVMRPIHGEEIRGLWLVSPRGRPPSGPERDQTAASLRLRRSRLCSCHLRHDRQCGSARGQMQKLSAGKFHGVPSEKLFWAPAYQGVEPTARGVILWGH